jgi:hypothetical protein
LLLSPASTVLADSVPLPVPTPGIVFLVDGSGHLPGPSAELARLISCECPALRVDIFDWSHGWGRVWADMYGHGHHLTQGHELACRIMSYRQACPSGRICIVGHSSGAAVVLAAADNLPPGSIDRIILLAPAVGCRYDLRPALRAACEGVDVFYSHGDWVSLSMNIAPTADLQFFVGAAGYHGFEPVMGGCPDEAALYANLRQYPGCHSGHFSCTKRDFLRDHVLPLFCTCFGGLSGGIHAANYMSAVVPQSVTALEQLPPVEQIEYVSPDSQGRPPTAGPGGVAPISNTLRLP